MLSRFANRATSLAAGRAFQAIRFTSTANPLIHHKEKAEEERYIRKVEEQELLRVKLDKILAEESAQKEELVKIIEKEEKRPVIDTKSWKFATPLAFFAAFPALGSEFITLDAELCLAACFMLFTATMHNNIGPMLNKMFDDYSQAAFDEIKALDDAVQDELTTVYKANESALSAVEDYKNLYQISDEIATSHAQALTNQEAHKFREAIIKKLESLSALEESAASAIRNRMVNKVHDDVVNAFKTDKKVQDSALEHAIAVLAGGQKAKLGNDVVASVFLSSLNNYKKDYEKLPEGSDEILVQLQKDMEAIASAPVVDTKGGNVFDLYRK